MAAQTWTTIMNACVVACSQMPYPYTATANAPDFVNTQFPMAMSDAELRIFRDMPFLGQRSTNIVLGQALVTTAASRIIAIPQPPTWATPIIVPEGLALLTPSGTTDPSQGSRISYDVASLDLIDLMWPVEATVVTPGSANDDGRAWALRDDHTIVYAPTADAAYNVELTGLYQPTPISAANSTTYLSTWYPDLLIDRAMVFLCGALLRNFGAMAGDAAQALTWEAKYAADLRGALAEEYRRRGLAIPDVAGVPPRAVNA